MKAAFVNSLGRNIQAIPFHEFTENPFKFALAAAFPSLMDVFYNYLGIPAEGKVGLHCIAVGFFALDADTTLEKVSAVAATVQCFRSIKEQWMK